MAAATKRTCENNDADPTKAKQSCVDLSITPDEENTALTDFLQWSNKSDFELSQKVRVGREGSCAQYGMQAIEDIEKGEILFKIPRASILSPVTSAISTLLKSESQSIESASGWVPLLLALMYEYHNPDSTWRPYLDLIPDFKELDLPMFWNRSELEHELKGTGVVEAVDKDLKSLTSEFETLILPFVKKHKEKFKDECEDVEFYKKMVAFVMAYSFTEPSTLDDIEDSDDEGETTSAPMMVPMADVLNHVAKNNAHLSFEKEFLKMVATKDIKKGDEVFNTYGELPNWQLLQMYGFAEAHPFNHYDTVEISIQLLLDHSTTFPINDKYFLEEKKDFLQSQNLLEDGATFVLGREGILTEEKVIKILKVLCMDKAEFTDHKEKDGWSDVDEEREISEQDMLLFANMNSLPSEWISLLIMTSESCLSYYNTSEEDDSKTLKDVGNLSGYRALFSLHTRHGQRQLLHKLKARLLSIDESD